jgi:hypothetical protein
LISKYAEIFSRVDKAVDKGSRHSAELAQTGAPSTWSSVLTIPAID